MLASEDYGQTWQRASLDGGGEAYFSGYVPGWQEARIDLSAFSGKKVHIALLLDTDPLASGEEAENPAGWWVDSLALATNYNTDIPTIGSVGVQPYTVLGTVPPQLELPVSVADTQRVVKVTYFLDMQPLGQVDAGDIIESLEDGTFESVLQLGEADLLPNQLAELRVQYYDAEDNPGPEITIPLWIFNQRGDVNADGVVDQADFDAFPAKIGLAAGDTGYVPFYDTDMDGVITEADANGIGYNWN